jgi:conjugative transfer region protein (TIGR03750 family)
MSAGTFFDDDGTHAADVAPLTDRINSEPPVLRGLSVTEVMIATALFFPVWLVIGLLAARLFSHWQILILLGIFGPLFSVWASAGLLASVKRNRPDHYYWQAWRWWLHRHGLWTVPFIAHRGAWDLGRSLPSPRPSAWGSRRTPSTPSRSGVS